MSTRIEERTQMGGIWTVVDGVPVYTPVPLRIIDTYHDDGRKDVEIHVPRLEAHSRKEN